MAFADVLFWVLAVASVAASLGVVLIQNVFRAALLLVMVLLAVAGFFVMMNAEFLAVVQVLIYAGAIAILIIFATMLTSDVTRGNLPNRLQFPAMLLPALILATLTFVAIDTQWDLLSDDKVLAESGVAVEEIPTFRERVEIVQANTLSGVPEADRRALEIAETEALERAQELRNAEDLTGALADEEKKALEAHRQLEAAERSGLGDLLINDFALPFEIAAVLLLAAVIGALALVREQRT